MGLLAQAQAQAQAQEEDSLERAYTAFMVIMSKTFGLPGKG